MGRGRPRSFESIQLCPPGIHGKERYTSGSCKHCVKTRNTKIHELALKFVAVSWQDDEPRCRFDTLPKEHPLLTFPCYGPLEIDHMNGGGNRDKIRNGGKGNRFFQSIVKTHTTNGLRILCQLHQLWNRR